MPGIVEELYRLHMSEPRQGDSLVCSFTPGVPLHVSLDKENWSEEVSAAIEQGDHKALSITLHARCFSGPIVAHLVPLEGVDGLSIHRHGDVVVDVSTMTGRASYVM